MSCAEPSGVAAGETMAMGSFCTAPEQNDPLQQIAGTAVNRAAGNVGVATQPTTLPSGAASATALARGESRPARNIADAHVTERQMPRQEGCERPRQFVGG